MKVFFKTFLLFILYIQYGYSQVVIESRLRDNVIIEELKQTDAGISGIYRQALKPEPELSYYLLWLDDGKFYVKKITSLSESEKKPVGESDFLLFYFPDKDSIGKSKIEEPKLNILKDLQGNDSGRELVIAFAGTLEIINLWTTKESVYLYLESVPNSDLSNPSFFEYNLKLKYDPWLKKLIEQINGLERDKKLILKNNS